MARATSTLRELQEKLMLVCASPALKEPVASNHPERQTTALRPAPLTGFAAFPIIAGLDPQKEHCV
jgi:hypothetical protein